MTQKKDTLSGQKTATPPEEAPAADALPSGTAPRRLPLLWLAAAGSLFIGAWWLIDSGGLDTLLGTREQYAARIGEATPDIPSRPAATRPVAPESAATPEDRTEAARQRYERQQQAATETETTRRPPAAGTDAPHVRQLEQRIQELTAQLSSLSESVGELRHTPPADAEAPAQNVIMVDNEATLRLHEEVTQLSRQLEQLQATHEQSTRAYNSRLALMQLVDDIAARLRSGESYEAEMQQLHQRAAAAGLEQEPVRILGKSAKDGALTFADLTDDFHDTIPFALPVSLAARENQSFGDRLRQRLAHIITIRRIDVDAADDSDEAHIARAEAELQMGNLEAALSHIGLLSETARLVFAHWQNDVREYLAAHEAVTQLRAALLQPVAVQSSAE